MIAFSCEGCGKAFRVADTLEGRKSRCKRCGAVTRIPPPPLTIKPRRPKTSGPVAWEPWFSLGVGAVLTSVALYVPLIAMVAWCLATVIHELGHTATSWLFGIPAIPAFDLQYGGGITRGVGHQPLLVAAVYGGFAYLTYQSRQDWKAVISWLALIALYSVAITTVLRSVLISAMGHGGELLFSGIFLYRALSGSQVLRREERPLYAFLGLFMLLVNIRLAWGLITSSAAREAYHHAHGDLTMDFDIIADEYLQWPLSNVAAFFLIACVLTPMTAFAAYRYGRRSR
jgi:hypothetical protein